MPVRIPYPGQQRRIGEILGALDDKIELNRRVSQTLESMARALFKSWFVHFDPIRAKADGNDHGLSSEIADIFPSSAVDSEFGEIPSGWKMGSILMQARLLSGGTPATDRPEYWNGAIPWVSARDVSQCDGLFLTKTDRTVTPAGLTQISSRLLPANVTVVVARGATTGRMAILGNEMAINQTCYGFESLDGTPFTLHLQIDDAIEALLRSAHGSIFNTITTNSFESLPVVLPPLPVRRNFEDVTRLLFSGILANERESSSLRALRDSLLPRLVSGNLSRGRILFQLGGISG
jgi:type I restriction enzyme S subunit